MEFYLDELTIKLNEIQIEDLLDTWTWLVEDFCELIFITKFGDLFFEKNSGDVYWLATDTCALTKVANNRAEFYGFLNDRENFSNWFLPDFIKELETQGLTLGINQVFSYKKMPVLGGQYSVDNIEPLDIEVHFQLTGIIGEKIKDLPDGTKINIKLTD